MVNWLTWGDKTRTVTRGISVVQQTSKFSKVSNSKFPKACRSETEATPSDAEMWHRMAKFKIAEHQLL